MGLTYLDILVTMALSRESSDYIHWAFLQIGQQWAILVHYKKNKKQKTKNQTTNKTNKK